MREPNSCLGRVFNFKLACFASYQQKWTVLVQPFLEMKTWPRVCPVNFLVLNYAFIQFCSI
jgi:hypothetical protein